MKFVFVLNLFRSIFQIELVFDNDTWSADLLAGNVSNSSGKTLFEGNAQMSETYIDQLKYFLNGLSSSSPFMNELSSSTLLLKYILKNK